jgi:hypothetical protein
MVWPDLEMEKRNHAKQYSVNLLEDGRPRGVLVH